MSLKLNRRSFLSDSSGVSVIFGAALLLGILMLVFSAYLITAVPAQILSKESAAQDSFHSNLLVLFEKITNPAAGFSSTFSKRGVQFFSSEHTTAFIDENDGRFLFAADISLPPESEKFLKTEDSDDLNDSKFSKFLEETDFEFEYFEIYTLGGGSIIFSNSYTQLPDNVYYFDPFSLIFSQKDGAVSVSPPSIRLSKNESGSALLSISGRILKSDSSSVFGNQTMLVFDRLQKAEGVGFVTAAAFQYIPSPTADSLITDAGFAENRIECIRNQFDDFHQRIQSEYPGFDSVYDSENICLFIYSEKPFEIYFCVEEFAIGFE